MKKDYVSHGRSVSDLKAHMVLTSKYRRKVFTGAILERMHQILEELLEKWDCKVVEFNGEEDHIHLLFQYHPSVELSRLVNNIKTITSRKLRQEFKEQVDEFYRKEVLWSSSYFIASCGGVTISTLKKYIENQSAPK